MPVTGVHVVPSNSHVSPRSCRWCRSGRRTSRRAALRRHRAPVAMPGPVGPAVHSCRHTPTCPPARCCRSTRRRCTTLRRRASPCSARRAGQGRRRSLGSTCAGEDPRVGALPCRSRSRRRARRAADRSHRGLPAARPGRRARPRSSSRRSTTRCRRRPRPRRRLRRGWRGGRRPPSPTVPPSPTPPLVLDGRVAPPASPPPPRSSRRTRPRRSRARAARQTSAAPALPHALFAVPPRHAPAEQHPSTSCRRTCTSRSSSEARCRSCP